MIGIFSAFRLTASALTSQRLRMDVIANNVANAETTRTEEGGPYQRQQVVFVAQQADSSFVPQRPLPHSVDFRPGKMAPGSTFSADLGVLGQGVRVAAIQADDSPGNRVYDANHPDADEDGFVTYPNVNVVTEMTDMLSATRAYEANVTVFNALKNMAAKALDIGRG